MQVRRRPHPRRAMEPYGAGSSPSAGSPPAPFTQAEECMPLAFRGGVRGPRLHSRIPEGREPRDQGGHDVKSDAHGAPSLEQTTQLWVGPDRPVVLHTVSTASSGPLRTSTISSGLLHALLVGSSMGSRLLLLATALPSPLAFAADRTRLSWGGGASGAAATSRRAASTSWQRRRPCPGSHGDQHPARDKLSDEAEHVALHGAVLGLLELGG